MPVYMHGQRAELATNKAFELAVLFCESSALKCSVTAAFTALQHIQENFKLPEISSFIVFHIFPSYYALALPNLY